MKVWGHERRNIEEIGELRRDSGRGSRGRNPGERATILNLFQLYMHDFSEFAEIGTLHGAIASDGRFAHAALDARHGFIRPAVE